MDIDPGNMVPAFINYDASDWVLYLELEVSPVKLKVHVHLQLSISNLDAAMVDSFIE